MTVLVVPDFPDTAPAQLGVLGELIGAAAALGPVAVLTDSRDSAEELGRLGAATVVVAAADAASTASAAGSVDAADSWDTVDAAEAAFERLAPDAIVLAHTVRGRDTAARLAVRLKRALLTDASDIRRDNAGIVTDHSNYGGAYHSVAAATHLAPVVTVRVGAVDKKAAPVDAPEVVELDVPASGRRVAEVVSEEVVERTSTRPDLLTADKVVAGGVSLGSEDMFEELVGGLADALGAAVGATRSAVDEGQVPYEAQIGQTGVMISPKLYIGVGISGAVQHLVGMQTSDTIVAINNDEDAPIFDIADFGIVGDIFDLVPAITAEINARKAAGGGAAGGGAASSGAAGGGAAQ